MRIGFRPALWGASVVLAWSAAAGAGAAETTKGQSRHDLTEVSLEDLMNIEVTSVSKKEQKLSKAGAAVFVITQEDIRRSGATNLPDVLRMAPGVHVARIDANTWAISIRGFTDRYGDKVLVLIDGRSVYTPSFSGVYWDQQQAPLENIERIEVIRGPGGTVWGANAVNGVINIITKGAEATRGALVSAGAGSETTADGLVQQGGALGSRGGYRVFARYFNVGNAVSERGRDAADGWHALQGGFRSDLRLSARDTMTVQGDVLRTRAGQPVFQVFSNALPLQKMYDDKVTVAAGNLLGRWNHTLANGSDTSLQVYFDRYRRVNQGVIEVLNTIDVDFKHHAPLGARHDVVWGLGYRATSDHFTPGVSVAFAPARRTYGLFGVFAQDEIKLTNALSLTLGSKFEHNAFTGGEAEPSAQLVWTPTSRQAVWLSAARAIRQPARTDSGLQVDVAVFPLQQGGFGVLKLIGAANPHAEQLHDFEIGYRTQVSKRLSLDLATFVSYYHHLQTTEPGEPYFTASPAPPHLVSPLVFDYKAHARNYGGELAATWNATSRWRISPSYAFLHMKVAPDPSSRDASVAEVAGYTPRHQFQIRSLWNLRRNLEWDSSLIRVSGLPSGNIAGYTRVDSRLGWRFGEYLELSVTGQNLLRPQHLEYPDAYQVLHTEIERSAFVKMTWRF